MPNLKVLIIFLFTIWWAKGQVCPAISYPSNGAIDISVNATITWPAVSGINGYLISLGTTPGGTDIINRKVVSATDTMFTPPIGMPENTLIYVSFSILLFNAPPMDCNGIRFTTQDVTTAPPCTLLDGPDNNAANVTVVTEITWIYAATATGYILSIGTTEGGVDILDNEYVGNVLSYDPPTDLPQDTRIYVTIRPTNENGDMAPCTEESFYTGALDSPCEPYLDTLTGEMVNVRPQLHFPDQIGICSSELPYTISTEERADGFRWYRTNDGSAETLLSEQPQVPILAPGRYRYEAYNTIQHNGITIECSDSKLFTVVASGIATIESISVVNSTLGKQITVFVSGLGHYEYALDTIEGPYRDNPVFDTVPEGNHTIYVKDKNGCGIAERSVDRDLTLSDFPKFFTPNGDAVNDYWQFVPPPENFEMQLDIISIFDRFGCLIVQIEPESKGWDGLLNGRPLPASDYWYRAISLGGRQITGHFTLKR